MLLKGNIWTCHARKSRCLICLPLELLDCISQSINALHTCTAYRTAMVSISSCVGWTSAMFCVPRGKTFIMWHGFVGSPVEGGGGGGVQTAVSHQPSVNCSQPFVTVLSGSEQERAQLKDMREPQQFQLEGHTNLFSHFHRSHRLWRSCAASYESVARGEWVATIWESLCVFFSPLIVSGLFTPTRLCWVLLFC